MVLWGFVHTCSFWRRLEDCVWWCFFCMYVWCFVGSGVGTNVEKGLNWYQESSWGPLFYSSMLPLPSVDGIAADTNHWGNSPRPFVLFLLKRSSLAWNVQWVILCWNCRHGPQHQAIFFLGMTFSGNFISHKILTASSSCQSHLWSCFTKNFNQIIIS